MDQSREAGPLRDRRAFFRFGMFKTLSALASLVERALPTLKPRTVLRPPGAVEEYEFLRRCFRCGSCVDACPVGAIGLLKSEDEDLAGTPYIDPDLKGCVLCDALPCVAASPSGALRPVGRDQVRMGRTRWREDHCLLSQGVSCTACVERCPLGESAIRLSAGRIRVNEDVCAGCGVCQVACPARPKAITVEPA